MRTRNASEAHYFMIPHYATAFYHRCVFQDGGTGEACKWKTGDYLQSIMNHIRSTYDYWDASTGIDHIIAFSWDQASEVLGIVHEGQFMDHPIRSLVRSAIHLTTLGTLVSRYNFDPHKDIVVPPYLNYTRYTVARTDLGDPARTSFAHFRGTIFDDYAYSQGVRQALRSMAATEPRLEVREGHSSDYLLELATTRFALCPSGWSNWSPRAFEAMAMGAIPVIYADGVRLPFEDFIDYRCALVAGSTCLLTLFTRRLIVKIENENVLDTVTRLDAISQQKQTEMQSAIKDVAAAFFFNDPPRDGDAFDYLLRVLDARRANFQPVAYREF